MLKRMMELWQRTERGDTLIEVTFALAILGFVLLSCTALATTAFRIGQTARERTQVADAAQHQMEALRSFRDNHTWPQFRFGSGIAYPGIDNVVTSTCQTPPWNADPTRHCFIMGTQTTTAGTIEYVPQTPGTSPVVTNVPTSIIELSTVTPASARGCGYDVELHYSFQTLGGGVDASNQIVTRLVDLHYVPPGGIATCP